MGVRLVVWHTGTLVDEPIAVRCRIVEVTGQAGHRQNEPPIKSLRCVVGVEACPNCGIGYTQSRVTALVLGTNWAAIAGWVTSSMVNVPAGSTRMSR